ncbi:hypothetical protein MRX96_018823 [Rhipicephalus microplus]
MAVVLRIIGLFAITLPDILGATLRFFGLSFAFLELFGLFLDDLLLHLHDLLTVRVLRTFVGTPFYVLRTHHITHLLCVRSAVQVFFSVFLGLASHGVLLLGSAVVCRLPMNAPLVMVTFSVPFLLFSLLSPTSPLAPPAAPSLAVAPARLTLSFDVASTATPTAATFRSLV